MSDTEKIPLADWRTDTQAAFALQDRLKASKDTYPEEFEAYFRGRYQADRDRSYRQARVASALNWLSAHIDALEQRFPALIVAGTEAAIGRLDVMDALWAMYSNMPDSDLGIDFPIEILDPYLRG